MVTGLFPQIEVHRDGGGIVRRVSSKDWLMPSDIKSETTFNWLGKPQESSEEYLGIKKQVQFSQKGKPITERIDFFGAYTVINNYDPITGEHLGSFMEVEDDD
jgi:hypothetical protein